MERAMNRRSRSRSRSRQRGDYRSRSPNWPNRHRDSFERKPKGGKNDRGTHKFHDNYRAKPYGRTDYYPPRKTSPAFDDQRSSASKREQDSPQHIRRASSYDKIRRSLSPKGSKHDPVERSLKVTPDPEEHDNSKRHFFGPEGTVVDFEELKKITVEIRRTLPRGVVPVAASVVRRKFDPSDVIIIRRPGEGSKPIFDREELRPNVVEERFIKFQSMGQNAQDLPLEHRQPSPELHRPVPDFALMKEEEDDLRARLTERRMDPYQEYSYPAPKAEWEPNPQRINYFEHDNRDRFRHDRRGHPRGRHFHAPNTFRGRRNNRGRHDSPDWKHDMYDSIDDKPSSTTKN